MSLMIKRLRDAGFRKARWYHQLSRGGRAALGAVFIEAMIQTTGMFEDYIQVRHNRRKKMVRYSQTYWDFLGRYKQAMQNCRTVQLPMLIQPRPWSRA